MAFRDVNTYPRFMRLHLEIGATQFRSVTEIEPKSLFLCQCQQEPCGFRAGAKAIKSSVV